MGRDPGLSRREWIAACGGTITAGLVGCMGDGDGDAGGVGNEGGQTGDSGTSAGSNDGDGTSDRSVDPGSVSAAGSWPMWRYDAAGSSFAPDRSGPSRPSGTLWSYEFSSEFPTVPIVRDGTVFAQTRDGRCVAIDAASGDERWRRDLERSGGERGRIGPAAADDSVFVGAGDVVALDPATGETRWSAPDIEPRNRLVYSDGAVYACKLEGIQAFDAASGEELWMYETSGDGVHVSVGGDGIVYAMDTDTIVTALDAATGEEHWTYDLEGQGVQGGLTPRGGSVYICDPIESSLLSLSGSGGDVEWQVDVIPNRPPAVTGDRLYVSTRSTVEAFDPDSGDRIEGWESPIGSNPLASPVVTEATGYLVTRLYSDRPLRFYRFDTDSGSTAWDQPQSAEDFGNIAVLEDVLVYGTSKRIVALA